MATEAVMPDSEQHPQHAPDLGGLTFRAVIIGLAFTLLFNVIVRKVELVTGRYIASGIPPIPAVTVLTLLAAFYPLGRRLFGRFNLSHRELLTIYIVMIVAVPLCATYGVRTFLPRLSVLQYYQTPENRFGDYLQYVPSWYAPEAGPVITDMYEGIDAGAVPWGAWIKPLGLWTLFFLGLYILTMSMMSVMAKQWSDGEHLPYPLVQLPMEMVESTSARGTLANFFTSPLMWVGVALAALYNGLNIAHAINPAIPTIEQSKALDDFFTERPWSAMNPLLVGTTPQYIGFGWLVSQELCFSIFVCTFLAKFAAVGGAIAGHEPPGWPYMQEQSAGGYLAMAAFTLWIARGHIRTVAGKALGLAPSVDDTREPMPYRWAVIGMVVGAVSFLLWTTLSGMSPAIAIPFFLIVMAYGLTYARVRAEVGVAHDFVYPYRLPQYTILYAIGSRGVLNIGGPRTMVIFTMLSFLSRFHPVQIMTAYQTDSFQIAKAGRLNVRLLPVVLIIAFVCGLTFAFWGHFATFYENGLNVMESNPLNADWRTTDTNGAYTTMVSEIETPTGPDWNRFGAIITGGAITLGLALVRMFWLRFPLHPLGYIVALSYGPSTALWFPFLLVWAIKGAVLKLGGIKLFRMLIPLFIAFVVAHYIFGGILWSVLSLVIEDSVSRRYYAVF